VPQIDRSKYGEQFVPIPDWRTNSLTVFEDKVDTVGFTQEY
jgi:hypothetical protein